MNTGSCFVCFERGGCKDSVCFYGLNSLFINSFNFLVTISHPFSWNSSKIFPILFTLKQLGILSLPLLPYVLQFLYWYLYVVVAALKNKKRKNQRRSRNFSFYSLNTWKIFLHRITIYSVTFIPCKFTSSFRPTNSIVHLFFSFTTFINFDCSFFRVYSIEQVKYQTRNSSNKLWPSAYYCRCRYWKFRICFGPEQSSSKFLWISSIKQKD